MHFDLFTVTTTYGDFAFLDLRICLYHKHIARPIAQHHGGLRQHRYGLSLIAQLKTAAREHPGNQTGVSRQANPRLTVARLWVEGRRQGADHALHHFSLRGDQLDFHALADQAQFVCRQLRVPFQPALTNQPEQLGSRLGKRADGGIARRDHALVRRGNVLLCQPQGAGLIARTLDFQAGKS